MRERAKSGARTKKARGGGVKERKTSGDYRGPIVKKYPAKKEQKTLCM